MRLSKYDMADLLAIARREKTKLEVANKYDTTILAVSKAMSRYGIWGRKKRIVVTTPYKKIICNSNDECARITKVSKPTILRALRGEDVPLLKELEIKVEYLKEVYYDRQTEEAYE